jgi:hypothetical protein
MNAQSASMSPSAKPQPSGGAESKVSVVTELVRPAPGVMLRYGCALVEPNSAPKSVDAPRKAEAPDAVGSVVAVLVRDVAGNDADAGKLGAAVKAPLLPETDHVGNTPTSSGSTACAAVGMATMMTAIAAPTICPRRTAICAPVDVD